MKGFDVWNNKRNRFAVLKLHYTADPDKRKLSWKKKAREGMTEEAWEQEYEINFEKQRGKRVYPEFQTSIHTANLSFKKDLPIYRGWDFGFHHPACLLTQIDTFDRWLWMAELMGYDESLEHFVERVQKISPKGFVYKDYCDPAGNQSTDKKERTSIQILNAYNIRPLFKRTNPEDRAQLIRSKLLLRTDGKTGLIVNKDCKIAIEGFMGGYHYPEVRKNKAEKETPLKDGFYEHEFDAGGYIAIFLFKYKKSGPRVRLPRRRRAYNPFTGTFKVVH